MSDSFQLLSDGSEMAANHWDKVPLWQEYRKGVAANLVDRTIPWSGQDMTFSLGTQMLTNARSNADLESYFPDIQKVAFTNLVVSASHLRAVDASVGYTIAMEQMIATDKEGVVTDIAAELVAQTEEVLAEKRNQMFVVGTRAIKAKIKAIKTQYGATYSQADTCLLQLTGSVGMFHVGELVDIRDEDSVHGTTLLSSACTVLAVIPDEYIGGLNVGPAIVLHLHGDNFDDVSVGDEIVASGETTDDGFVGGLSTLCDFTAPDGSTTPADYYNIHRYTPAGYGMIPNGRAYGTTIDVPTHLSGDMVRTLGRVVPVERDKLRRRKAFDIFEGLVLVTGPDLGAEIAAQSGDATCAFQRTLASSIEQAKGKMFAQVGWEGTVLHQIGFPPIAVEYDSLLDGAGTVTVFDPNQWAWIVAGGKAMKPTWARDGGGIWHLDRYSDGNAGYVKLGKRYRAGASLPPMTPICFRPKTVWQGQTLTP